MHFLKKIYNHIERQCKKVRIPYFYYKKMRVLENLSPTHTAKLYEILTREIIANANNPSAVFAIAKPFFRRKVSMINNQDILARYLELFRPYISPSQNLVRIGGNGDGGYSMFAPPAKNKGKLDSAPKALSLGVSNYSPWDLEMANMGYEVLEFDASIESSPYPNHPNIKFFKQFVGTQDDDKTISLQSIFSTFDFDENAHNILQCDIENAEWDILEKIDMSLLARYFSQMVFELHYCYPDDAKGSETRLQILSKINEYFVPIWLHFNNYADMLIGKNPALPSIFCPSVEISYIRKDLLPKDAKPFDNGVYALEIDTPNCHTNPDIPVIFPPLDFGKIYK